jgi:hypothetical protein
MLISDETKRGTTGKVIRILVLVIAMTISIDAVLLLGLVNMFTVGQLILPALAAAMLAAGFLITVSEFCQPR